jgi:hypothetical protein
MEDAILSNTLPYFNALHCRWLRAYNLEPQYTEKQGQYLAFIYYYTKLNGYPPIEKLSTRHRIANSVVIAWLSLWQLSRLKFQTTSQNNWLNKVA